MSNVKKFRIIKFKSKPILAAKSISKSFDKRVILRNIDISLNKEKCWVCLEVMVREKVHS